MPILNSCYYFILQHSVYSLVSSPVAQWPIAQSGLWSDPRDARNGVKGCRVTRLGDYTTYNVSNYERRCLDIYNFVLKGSDLLGPPSVQRC